MLDEPRYQEIREQLKQELYHSPNSNHGLYCLTSLAQIVGNQEFEEAVRAESERRDDAEAARHKWLMDREKRR